MESKVTGKTTPESQRQRFSAEFKREALRSSIVVPATTFVTRLAIIAILPAMRFMEDLIGGFLALYPR